MVLLIAIVCSSASASTTQRYFTTTPYSTTANAQRFVTTTPYGNTARNKRLITTTPYGTTASTQRYFAETTRYRTTASTQRYFATAPYGTTATKSAYCMESEAITNWGSWGSWDECGDSQFVYGFSVKVEPYQGDGDDTMANGVKFFCRSEAGATTEVTSTVQKWGSWSTDQFCSGSQYRQQYVNAVRLLVQVTGPKIDDGATLGVEVRCQNGQTMKAGIDRTIENERWTQWMECPAGWAVAGLKTQVEESKIRNDDTALNRVGIYCRPFDSSIPHSSCT